MYSKVQFEADFIRAYGYLGPANFRRGKLAKNAAGYIAMCFKVYSNAAHNVRGELLVGRIVKRDGESRPINIEQIGHGLDDIEKQNFGTTNDAGDGSVLSVDNYWTAALNDSWLMGGIHAGVDFYLASPRTKTNVLDPSFATTVTGRELFGLTTFGYTLHPQTKMGEVYVCTNRGAARGATLAAYETAYNTAKRTTGFGHLVNPNA
jgi:hypothetical protein